MMMTEAGTAPMAALIPGAKHILITGAGGFVGRHIVNALEAAGHRVTALDHVFDQDLKAAWSRLPAMRLIEASDQPYHRLLSGQKFDVLIHAAAVTASPEQLGQSPLENLRANLDPAWDALTWFLDVSPHGRAIVISSSGVFRATQPGPVSEDTLPSPLGTYALAKASLEATAETLNVQYGQPVIAVRLSNLFGPGEYVRPTRPRLSLVGSMVQDALSSAHVRVPDEPPRDWTYAPDVGNALRALIAAPVLRYALYNVASGESLAPTAIAAVLQRLVPNLTIEIAPPERQLTRLGWLSPDRLYRDTGFQSWTPFERGLAETVQAFRVAAASGLVQKQLGGATE
jgi:UDP-glucose 4-epimerase